MRQGTDSGGLHIPMRTGEGWVLRAEDMHKTAALRRTDEAEVSWIGYRGIKGHMHFRSELLDQSSVSFLEKRVWEAFYCKQVEEDGEVGGRFEAADMLEMTTPTGQICLRCMRVDCCFKLWV